MPQRVTDIPGALETAQAQAAKLLSACKRLLVLAGAGLSADAGIPTFRCANGLWQNHKVEELAHPEGFAKDPERVWEWYRERRLLVASSSPHTGQRSLALLQRHFPVPNRVLFATTNEDDLLTRAGINDVIHMHGSLFATVCSAQCGWVAREDADNAFSMLPCPQCGARVRPGSVWYGEALPAEPLQAIARFNPDGCLLVGSSCLVQPAAAIPSDLVIAGLPVVEVNPEETMFSPLATCSIRGTAKEVLPGLVDLMTSRTVQDQRRRIT